MRDCLTAEFNGEIDRSLSLFSLHIFALMQEHMGMKDVKKFEVSARFISQKARLMDRSNWHRDFSGKMDFISFFYFHSDEVDIPANTQLTMLADISDMPKEKRVNRQITIAKENQFILVSTPGSNTVTLINNIDVVHKAPVISQRRGHILRLQIKVIE